MRSYRRTTTGLGRRTRVEPQERASERGAAKSRRCIGARSESVVREYADNSILALGQSFHFSSVISPSCIFPSFYPTLVRSTYKRRAQEESLFGFTTAHGGVKSGRVLPPLRSYAWLYVRYALFIVYLKPLKKR